MSEKTLLAVQDLSLEIEGERILKGLSLDIWAGHVHAIIGPNGAGKSTLAYTIMGVSGYTDFGGDVVFDGESLKGLPVHERARRGITLGWQEPARYEGLLVKDFIQAGAPEDAPESEIAESLEKVGLDPARYLERAIDKSLSGGERKRVEIASIFVMRPRLVIMDEPDSGIDVDALNRIFDVLKEMKERGSTIMMITHSLTVLRQAEHAFLICDGRMMDKGSVDRIATYFEENCLPCDFPNQPEERPLQEASA